MYLIGCNFLLQVMDESLRVSTANSTVKEMDGHFPQLYHALEPKRPHIDVIASALRGVSCRSEIVNMRIRYLFTVAFYPKQLHSSQIGTS